MTGLFFDYGRTFVQPLALAPERTALVVVDMQYHDASVDQGFNLAMDRIEPGSMDYFNGRNEGQVIPAIARLLEFWRSRSLPVIYLTLGSDYRDYRDLPPRFRSWVRTLEQESGVHDLFWAGSPAFAIRREIAPLAGETVIQKTTFGAFNSTTIEQTLRHMAIDDLVVTGISTNCCVETTARDAADRGFGVAIVDEATADYDEPAHEAALRAFHFNFGPIFRTVDDALGAIGESREVPA